MMNAVDVGHVAPSFRLPSGQGPEVGPEDYRGRHNVIVWFTKGMACAFCRTQMAQLRRGYSTLRDLNAEILQVTPTTPERARFYASRFPIPYPYLSDPDYRVRRAWGLEVRSHSLAWYARTLVSGLRLPEPPTDFGKVPGSVSEIPALLADEDMGFFILDRDGVVRYRLVGAYAGSEGTRPIPSNDEIAAELRRLAGGAS
jgi:peroxiredoxin